MLHISSLTILSIIGLAAILCSASDPYKIAFRARWAATAENPLWRGGDILTFPVVELNAGAGFNVSTGVFTCPVTGVYMFSVHLMRTYPSQSERTYCQFHIRVNRKLVQHILIGPSKMRYMSDSATTVACCRAGQPVWVEMCTCSKATECKLRNAFNSFSGALVHIFPDRDINGEALEVLSQDHLPRDEDDIQEVEPVSEEDLDELSSVLQSEFTSEPVDELGKTQTKHKNEDNGQIEEDSQFEDAADYNEEPKQAEGLDGETESEEGEEGDEEEGAAADDDENEEEEEKESDESNESEKATEWLHKSENEKREGGGKDPEEEGRYEEENELSNASEQAPVIAEDRDSTNILSKSNGTQRRTEVSENTDLDNGKVAESVILVADNIVNRYNASSEVQYFDPQKESIDTSRNLKPEVPDITGENQLVLSSAESDVQSDGDDIHVSETHYPLIIDPLYLGKSAIPADPIGTVPAAQAQYEVELDKNGDVIGEPEQNEPDGQKQEIHGKGYGSSSVEGDSSSSEEDGGCSSSEEGGVSSSEEGGLSSSEEGGLSSSEEGSLSSSEFGESSSEED